MKITDNRGNSKVIFKDMSYGEAFEDKNKNIFIRIATVSNEFGSWNAVSLKSGCTTCFANSDEVTKLNVELIIS